MVSDMQTNTRIQKITQQIQNLKNALLALQDMRPGSLSRQYNVCGKPGCRCKHPKNPQRHGPYYKLSYVHRGKFTSQFIKPHHVAQVQAELANYKQFRQLTRRWIALALQLASLKLKLEP